MFKKTLTVFQLTQPMKAVLERLADSLRGSDHLFKPCAASQQTSTGFVPPLTPKKEIGELLYETNGGVLFCLRTDTKKCAKASVDLRAEKIIAERKAKDEEVSKTDERLIKDEIRAEILKNAEPEPSWTNAYFDKQRDLLLVWASDEDADAFVKSMKSALGGVPFTLLEVPNVDLSDKFTEWVKDTAKLGKAFKIGCKGTMKHPDKEGGCGIINIEHEDLDSDEFKNLIDTGRLVCAIGLEHKHYTFRLTSKLGIRNIEFSKDTKALTFDESAGEATMASTFAVWTKVNRDVLDDLELLFGEWPKQEMLDLSGEDQAA